MRIESKKHMNMAFAAIACLAGLATPMRSHMRASINVSLTATQLRQLTQVLAERGDAQAAKRADEALTQALALMERKE